MTTIQRIAKKIYKAGRFKITDVSKSSISFTNGSIVFCWQRYPKPKFKDDGIFRAGYVTEYQKVDFTYESEYQKTGIIDCAHFNPIHQQSTDNPDYVLRAALHLINPMLELQETA